MKRPLTLLFLLIFSSSLLALGTGQPQLHSLLGEPLRLEVPLYSASRYDDDQLNITIADNAIYQKLGFDFSHGHQQLQFELMRDGNNKATLLITTEHSIKEPYLHFLLHIKTPHSTLIRDIPVLVDTPPIDSFTSLLKEPLIN